MKVVKLGEVCRLRNGYAFKSENFADQGVPVIRISDIQDNLVSPENSERVVYETIFENYRIVKGDILIAMSGATTGKFGVYNSNEDAFQNQRVGCFKIIDSRVIYQKYLLFVLHIAKPIIERKANGGAQPNISASSIEEIEIPLPTLEDQIRIATVLSKVETLIKLRKESIALLDEFLKSIFLKMFGDPLRNEKGWKATNMNNISLQITDGEHTTPIRTDSGIKLLSARNIKNGYIDFEAGLDYIGIDEYLRISKRCNPEKDDILMSCSGSVGRVSIIETEEQLSLVRSVSLIKLKKEIVNPLYIQSWMQSNHFQNEVKRGAKTSSQSNIFTGAIKKLPVLIPPMNLQTEFSSIVKRTNILKTHYQNSLKELDKLFASLSQKAFKGELDLSKMGVFYEEQYSSTDNDRTEPSHFEKPIDLNTITVEVKREKEDKRYGDPFEVDENTAKKQGGWFYKEWKKLNIQGSTVPVISKETESKVAGERLAMLIKERYIDKHFSFEMLANFIKKEKAYDLDKYFSSEEIKANPKYDELEDLKVFLESAIVNIEMDEKQKEKKNPWLHLNQHFYNAKRENISLELTKEDFALIKNRTAEERSGIYFNIVPDEIN